MVIRQRRRYPVSYSRFDQDTKQMHGSLKTWTNKRIAEIADERKRYEGGKLIHHELRALAKKEFDAKVKNTNEG